MVIPLDPDATTQLLSQLVSRYAHYCKKAIQSGQITPRDAAALMAAYGEGMEHAMQVFLQEDRFQPNAAVDQIRAQVTHALLEIDPDDALNHPI